MHWYLGRHFLFLFLGLEAALVITAILFEGATSRSVSGWSISLFKIPFLVHRTLPFVIFMTTLIFMWRLIRFHEWEIFASAGASLRKILMAPLGISFGISMLDLLVLMPVSHSFLSPQAFKEKDGRITVGSAGWFAREDEEAYTLWFWDGASVKKLDFDKGSVFRKQVVGRGSSETEGTVRVASGWVIQNDGALTPVTDTLLSLPLKEKEPTAHPSMMSFLDTSKATPHNLQQARAVTFRQGYLLANALWMIILVPLAAAVMIGPAKRRKIQRVVAGLAVCFGIYLVKEWLYAVSMPMSYLLQPVISWVVPGVTLLLAMLILFEKNEL